MAQGGGQDTDEATRGPEDAGAGTGAEAGHGGPVLAAGDSSGGPGLTGWRRWLGTKQVAAAVLLLLAAEVGYVVHLTSSTSSSAPHATALPPLSALAPATTMPVAGAPTAPSTSAPSASAPSPSAPSVSARSTTVAAKTATATAKPATTASATAAPPGYCTAGDLDFTTTTDSSMYWPGDTVSMTMAVTDVTACIFEPEPVGASDCASTLAVVHDGSQVFPNSGYAEDCDPPPAQIMNAGSKEAVTASWTIPWDWNVTHPPGGGYEAVGEWGWSAGAGQSAHAVDIASTPFTIQ